MPKPAKKQRIISATSLATALTVPAQILLIVVKQTKPKNPKPNNKIPKDLFSMAGSVFLFEKPEG